MKLFRKDPIVTFTCDPKLYGSIPNPVPAEELLPKWIRKMNPENSSPRSIKRCVPVVDAMSMGYIVPLWADVHVNTVNGIVHLNYKQEVPSPMFTDHHPDQVAGCPLHDSTFGNQPLKLLSPWIITTPPGWSCLFIQPINHFDKRFSHVSGVVDTDTYRTHVNSSFIWMQDNFCGVLPKGTPWMQVIPFQRTECTHVVRESTAEDVLISEKANAKIYTVLSNGYRLNFWNPKKYK